MMILVTFLAGLLFGLGLAMAEMTNPAVVIGFLDILGDWNPSLIAVMFTAIAITMIAYRIKRHMTAPYLGASWDVPTRRDIDKNLIVGAILFGIGWGLSGYCPGPGLIALLYYPQEGIYFVVALLTGASIFQLQTHRNNA